MVLHLTFSKGSSRYTACGIFLYRSWGSVIEIKKHYRDIVSSTHTDNVDCKNCKRTKFHKALKSVLEAMK